MTIWQRIRGTASEAADAGSLLAGLKAMLGAGSDDGQGPQTDIRFTIALIALCAKMARSDGAVTLDEVEAFGRVVTVPASEQDNVRRLFDLAKQDTAGFDSYARQIGGLLAGERQLLLDVVEALCVIAAADGVLHEREDAYLKAVAELMGVEAAALTHIRSLFVPDAAGPYEVLGLTPAASDAEIRARHRALVLANHPDKLTGRGVPKEFVAVAERKLAAINAAFDEVARERGL